ncbi:unnamed protein product [Fasciola hepatica]|uniref:SCP domain-containing protein n=1 Tax=Fasciola hepatica TaxID=6192 RepID=A0ABC9HFQ6_FASHE
MECSYDCHPQDTECDAYTQVIWAKSEAIRCGKQICKNVPNVLFDGVIVCNYGPAGNLERENALMKRKIMTNLHYRRQQQQLQRQQKKA